MLDWPVPSRSTSTSTDDSLVVRVSRAVRADPEGVWFSLMAGPYVLDGTESSGGIFRNYCVSAAQLDRELIQESRGFRLGAGRDPQMAGDADIPDQHPGGEQSRPDRLRVFKAAEEDKVRV